RIDSRPGLGFDGGNPLPGPADATGRYRRLERRAARRTGEPRRHDRHRDRRNPRLRGDSLMSTWRTSADIGGLPGFGRVEPEADEPLFHASWEPMAMAITLALGATGRWTIDHSRSQRESLPLERYRANTYYQIWLDALEAQERRV